MNDLTSICLCVWANNEKRLRDLVFVLQSLEANLVEPCEVVIVEDKSLLAEDTLRVLNQFKDSMAKSHPEIPVQIHVNETNLKHARSQNKSMELAKGKVLVHIEDDCEISYRGWNQVFAKYLQDHPEIGLILPKDSGRGEYIGRAGWPIAGYREFSWGLGGIWAIKRDVWNKIGGWSVDIQHQIEPEYCFRVRMEGWRVAEAKEFAMTHFGEGDEANTFERQAQITIGVYNFLKKWNRRFMGIYGYHTAPCMSPDDFPINVWFRRQLAASFASQVSEYDKVLADQNLSETSRKQIEAMRVEAARCRLNENPEPFKFPSFWGAYELVKLIRPTGRERENELIEKMGQGYVFRDEPELHKQIKELAARFKKPMTDEEVAKFLDGKELEFNWTCEAKPI